MIKSLIYQLLNCVDRVLQWIVRPDPQQLCYCSVPDYADNAYYLFRHAINTRKNLTHVWLVHDVTSEEQIRHDFAAMLSQASEQHCGHQLDVRKWHSVAGYWAFIKSGVVFHTHGMFAFSRQAYRRVRVGLWHGMPLKCVGRLNKIAPNPYPAYATHYVAASHFFKYIMACAFETEAERVLVTGQPRCDVLLDTTFCSKGREHIMQTLGLNAERRLIMWLPTFRAEPGATQQRSADKRSFLDELGHVSIEQLVKAAEQAQCALVIKLHPNERADLSGLQTRWRHVRIFTSEQWQELGLQLYDVLACANGLISDVSSVLLDFALTGKPMAIMGFDSTRYTRDLAYPFEWVLADTNITQIQRSADLTQFVSKVNDSVCMSSAAAPRWLSHNCAASASEQLLSHFLSKGTAVQEGGGD